MLDQQLAPATLRLHLLIVLGLQKGTTILKFVLKTWMVQIWTQALWLPHESPVATEAISPGLIPLLSEFLFSPQELRLTRCPSGFLWYAGSFGIVRSGPPSPRGSGWSSLSKADSCAQTMPILEGTLASSLCCSIMSNDFLGSSASLCSCYSTQIQGPIFIEPHITYLVCAFGQSILAFILNSFFFY